jgi:hypothetical protein
MTCNPFDDPPSSEIALLYAIEASGADIEAIVSVEYMDIAANDGVLVPAEVPMATCPMLSVGNDTCIGKQHGNLTVKVDQKSERKRRFCFWLASPSKRDRKEAVGDRTGMRLRWIDSRSANGVGDSLVSPRDLCCGFSVK